MCLQNYGIAFLSSRIVLGLMGGVRIGLSTAVKIARRRIDLSTAVKQWRGIRNQCHRDLSTAVTGIPRWSTNNSRSIHCNSFSNNAALDFREIGYTDVADLLSTPERDFLLKNNGQKVLISSLRGKLVGLYFCDNITHPPRMQAIKKVYEEAKSRGYDFEIVQITFHYRCSNAKHLGIDPIVRQCSEDISWLTLPSRDPMDPTCRKIQRIFECADGEGGYWVGDSLVLVYPPQAQAEARDRSGVLFEFSGAEILKRWGIEGYPFTRPSLCKAEYEVQKRKFTLQWLFPPGECLLRRHRSVGDGFDLVDAFSQLSGKRVLVLFDDGDVSWDGNFLSMLKSEYHAQLKDNVAEENKFEVVCVSIGIYKSLFYEFTNDMPWLVRPFCSEIDWENFYQAFEHARNPAAVAFNEQGELIAKEDLIDQRKEGDKFRFPFIDQDLEKRIRWEVNTLYDVQGEYDK